VSDRNGSNVNEEAEQQTTDVGEGERGITAPARGGTFRETPGEAGDKAEGDAGGPGITIPHRQDK
jgi:hypothetical protein